MYNVVGAAKNNYCCLNKFVIFKFGFISQKNKTTLVNKKGFSPNQLKQVIND